jgi:hypothetical protein
MRKFLALCLGAPIALTLLALFLATPAYATQLYTSDNSTTGFDATTVGSLPTGWTAITGTWSAQTTGAITGHTHTLADTSQTDNDTALYTAATATADMEVVVTQKMVNASSSNFPTFMAAIARSNVGGSNLYLANMENSGQVSLYKKVSGTFTQIALVSAGLSWSVGDVLIIRFQVIGTSLKAKYWNASGAEPASWTITVTDSAVSAAGYGGVRCGEGTFSGQATLSDFSVDSVNGTNAFIVASPTQITPSGGNVTISGTYTGTPASVDYNVDGGSYAAASSPTISAGNFSFPITAPSTGYHTIGVRDHTTTTTTDTGVYNVAQSTSVPRRSLMGVGR